MSEGGDRSGAKDAVQIFRGRRSAKVWSLIFLTFCLAGNFELYSVSLFSVDISTRPLDKVLASFTITFVFIVWTIRAFAARVELYDDRIAYRGSSRHRVIPISSINRLIEDKRDPGAYVLLGNDKHYMTLGTFEFHRSDIERICGLVEERVRGQGGSVDIGNRGLVWLHRKQYLQWPPDYLSIISMVALIRLIFFR